MLFCLFQIVGAGGNTGGVCFGLAFRQFAPNYKPAFIVMGSTILGSCILSLFISIKGYGRLLWGSDEKAGKRGTPEPIQDRIETP